MVLLVSELKLESFDSPITISRITNSSCIQILQKLELQLDEKLEDLKDVTRLVKAKLEETVIHPSNIIVIDFLNKKLKFSVKSVKSVPEEDIVKKFAKIQLSDDKFYYVEKNSVIEIVYKDDKQSDSEDKGPKYSLSSIGGLDTVIVDLKRSMDLALGVIESGSFMKIPRAVLIHGLSGSGKTMLCHGLAANYEKAHIITIDSWKIFSKFYGESEANLRKHFDEAFRVYPTPAVIIIDEIANICPKNDSSDSVKRVATLLAQLIDSLHTKRDGSRTFVLTNTSHLDNVDPSIRRSGRLDFEVEIPVPNSEIREKILLKMMQRFSLTSKDIKEIAKHTHGYVAADLENLISKSLNLLAGSSGKFEEQLTLQTIVENMSTVKPSAMRELLVEKPNVKWSDIGGMKDLKLKLKQIVEWPINHPETFERLGIKPPRGLLMFGPPGNKTILQF